MKRDKSSLAGYSLVELLIAMVIAAIMFSGIYAVNIETMNILQVARSQTRAVQAAQYELEKLRSYSWAIIDAMAENTPFDATDNAVLALLNNGSGTIKKTLYSPSQILEPMYAISVTVSWTEFNGQPESKTVTSVITKRGIIR